jgi:hypothetical protein
MTPSQISLAGVLAIVAGSALGQQTSAGVEAEKASRIAALLQRPDYQKPSEARPASGICGPMLDVLATAGAEVKFVEPVIQTADADHPGLSRYRSCDRRFHDPATKHQFRLYRLEVQSDPKTTEEYLYEYPPGYVSLEPGRCSLRDVVSTAEDESTYNGLIHFRGGVYIFELSFSAPRRGYEFRVRHFEPQRRTFEEACAVDTRMPSKPPKRRAIHLHDFVNPY